MIACDHYTIEKSAVSGSQAGAFRACEKREVLRTSGLLPNDNSFAVVIISYLRKFANMGYALTLFTDRVQSSGRWIAAPPCTQSAFNALTIGEPFESATFYLKENTKMWISDDEKQRIST